MNMIRWEPFRTFEHAFGRMPALFDRWPRVFDANAGTLYEWSPSVDISETEGEYLLRADLPAVKKDDVRVTFEDGMLTLSGERKQREEEKGEKFYRLESIYGKFSRCFWLPDNVESKDIRAEARDGVLMVHVPKSRKEIKKSTEIRVQ